MGELAINGGTPVHQTGWEPWPRQGPEELERLKQVLEAVRGQSRPWGGMLPVPRTAELEQKMAAYHDCGYGVAVSSGAAALEVGLIALNLELGDEVIVPVLTWVATAVAVFRAGGVPVFVDVDRETFCLDADLIEAAITPRTKAILPVHLSGYAADVERVMEVAQRHDLKVLEDCAQAIGTKLNGKAVGAFGDCGIFSFQSSKFMTAGEGGMIITQDETIARWCHAYKDCGRWRADAGGYMSDDEADQKYGSNYGWNYRLTEFQAAVLLAQLERVEEHKATRVRNATWLGEQILKEVEGIAPTLPRPGQNIWRFWMRYDPGAFAGVPKQRFVAALGAEGIPCALFYPTPLYRNKMFLSFLQRLQWSPGLTVNPRKYGKDSNSYPVGDQAYDEELFYIWHNALLGSREDVADVVAAMVKIQRHAEELL